VMPCFFFTLTTNARFQGKAEATLTSPIRRE